MKRILLVGGGGHSRVLIDLIRSIGRFEIAGILDPHIKPGTLVLGVPVIGDDTILSELLKDGVEAASVAVGSIGDNSTRRGLYEKIARVGFEMPYLIHPRSIVSGEETVISDAVQVMPGAVIQTGCMIGNNSIVNTGAIVEHGCVIERHVHVCPGALLSGGCRIGGGAFIGAGAILTQGISIGRGAVVGAGAVVIRNVPDRIKVKGVPAR